MNNFIAKGSTLPYTVAGSQLLTGVGRLVGEVVGIATKTGEIGDEIALQIEGVVEYDKQAALAVGQGVKVYLDTTADEVDTTNTNAFMGVAWKAALAGDAKIQVLLTRLGD